MDADEIIALNAETVQMLMESRQSQRKESRDAGRRRNERWPFPGTTQIWVYDAKQGERLLFATCMDVSSTGVGVRLDELLPVGAVLTLAIHQPEASYHGKAIVRHCTQRRKSYHAGLQFKFD